ncbi:MAG TPA: translocation/assembly module TamB domain-containing protein, partial [Vicinamibacteria bacterium]|nr:translocation/assembly module TamB domain-containing protein [Vicinamibacteria bacterium]
MDRAENLPQATPPTPGRRLRRFLAIVLVLVLVTLLPVLVGMVLLHSKPGRRAVQAFLETTVGKQVGGTLKMGSLDYSLLGGRAAATDVHLALPGTTVDLGEVQAYWTMARGGRLRLVRPRIVLRDTGRPKPVPTASGIAARPWTVLERLYRAELVDGRVEVQDVEGVAYLVLGRIDATMQEHLGRRPIRLSVKDGVVGPPQHQLSPVVGSGSLLVEKGQLVFNSLHVEARGSTVDLSGSLERLSPNQGTLHLRADADGALAAIVAPETRVTGRIRAQAEVAAHETMSGTVRIAAPDLKVQDVGPWDASLRGHVDSSHLVIEQAEAKGYGGRFSAFGPVAMADNSRTDVILKADSVDIAALGRAAARSEVPLRSRLSGQVRFTLQGWDVNRGRAEGSLTLVTVPEALPHRRDRVAGIPVSASTRLLVEGRQVRLRDLRVDAHSSLLVGDLDLSPTLDVKGHYHAELPLTALPALEADMGMAAGTLLVGKVTADGEIGGTAQDPVATLRLAGSGIATAATAKQETVSIEGSARYARGRLQVEPLVVRSSSGGQATFNGGVPVTAKGGSFDVDAVVEALDLRPMLAIAGLDGSGPLNGRVHVSGPAGEPSARAEMGARVTLAGSQQEVEVKLAGTGDARRLAVQRLDVTLAGGSLSGTGSYELRTRNVQAQASAQGLHVAQLPMLPPSAKGLDGVFAGSLTVSGTAEAPAGELRGTLAQASDQGQPLPELELAGHSDGRQVQLTASSATDPANPQTASVFLRGSGSLEGKASLRIEIDAAALPLQAMLDALPAAREEHATVQAQGRLVLEVPLRAPRELRYSSDGLAASGRLRDLEWTTQTFRLRGDGSEATINGLRLTTTSKVPASRQRSEAEQAGTVAPSIVSSAGRPSAGGSLAVEGRVAIAADRRFDLRVQGDVDLAMLRALMPEEFVAGRARLDLRVAGTPKAPDLTGQASLEDARGRFGSVRVSSAQGTVRFEGDHATLERFEARTLDGRVTAAGSFPVRELSGRAPARLHFEVADLDLSAMQTGGELPGIARDPDQPGFFVSMSGDVEASAPTAEGVRARGRFTRLEETSPEGKVALQSPAEWTLEKGRFVQSPIRMAGKLGTLEMRADAQLAGSPMRGSAVVSGPIELRMLNPFLTDLTAAGPSRVDVRASWDPGGVRIEGGLSAENARLALESFAFQATSVTGQVRLLGDRMSVDLKAAAADGQLAITGGMSFGPRLLGPADLRIEAQNVPLAYPEGFRARASGTIRVSGDASGYRVGGNVGLTQAYYTAPFDQRKQSLDRLDWQLAALQGESLTESMPLAIGVHLDEPLRIRDAQAQLDLVGDLSVGGTAAQPVVSGQVTILEGGQLTVRRAQIRTRQGRIELNGYPASQPEVDFSGLTSVTGIEMDITARGTLDDLQLQITSSNRPDLSQTDLVSLLLTGRTAQAAAADSGAIVAEELASALGGVLQKGIGETLVVDVGPDRSLLSEDTDPTQRFTVGTRLRQDLMVLYSARLDGTDQRWMLDFNPSLGRLRFRLANETSEGNWVEVTDRFSVNFLGGRAPAKPPRENLQVVAVRFEGDLPLPQKQLQKACGIKPGRRYDALAREKSADKVRDTLVKAGWRAATADATSHAAAGHKQSLELVLHVDAGPKVEVAWTGDDPGKKVRSAALKAWPA